jgi:ABC-2 type transport system ATP-binding protein
MEPFQDRPAGKQSGGMKQKLSLMCALLHRPEVLFLDEPTNGVDPVSRRDFWAILYQLVKEGMTVVVTTAYLDEAERCNRVGLMHQGRLLALDAPRQIKSLMAGELVEILVTEAWRAREVLAVVAGIKSVTLFGHHLHIAVEEAARGLPAVQAALTAAGLAPREIRRIAPSLEDVFISMVERGSGAPHERAA